MVWSLKGAPVKGRWIDTEYLDGDISKLECKDMSQDGGTTFRSGYESALRGRRIKSDYVPTKIEWRSKMPVSDYGTILGLSLVTDRFKDVVEQLEPNVHQFLPVEAVNRKKEHISHNWFFVPCNRIDSVDEKHTTMVRYKGGWSNPKDFVRRGWEELLPDYYDPEKKSNLFLAKRSQRGITFGATNISALDLNFCCRMMQLRRCRLRISRVSA